MFFGWGEAFSNIFRKNRSDVSYTCYSRYLQEPINPLNSSVTQQKHSPQEGQTYSVSFFGSAAWVPT